MPRTDRASRVIHAPAARIYAALVDADALVAWLPPDGMTGRFDRFDARPGGGYRLVLRYRDPAEVRGKAAAGSDVVEARFVELVPGERVVQEVDFVSDDPAFAGTMTMTWAIAPTDGGSTVEIIAEDVPDGISAEDHAVGMTSSLANLAAHVEPADLGQTGGVVWSDPDEWDRRRQPEGCVICTSGGPLDVIAETSSCWVTAEIDAPVPGYVCVVSKRHVCEPFELAPDEQAAFWLDAMKVARGIAEVDQPIKMNYEVHGNTLPHLHLHLFPRHIDDPYVGGPIDPRRASFRRSPEQLATIRDVVRTQLASA